MKIACKCRFLLCFIILFQCFEKVTSQNEEPVLDSVPENFKVKFDQLIFFDYRGTNSVDIALGASTLLGDVENSNLGFYFKAGYKRSVLDNLFLGIAFNKYDLLYNSIEQNLLSIDFNLEFLALPYKKFSPFVYGGFGYNSLDDFEVSAVKLQGGIGVEYIITYGLGIRLFGEYNYSLDDEMDFLILDEEDDKFLRVGLGANLYFGGYKERMKRLENIPTKIKSNPIIPDN